jgi:hypothetical protein
VHDRHHRTIRLAHDHLTLEESALQGFIVSLGAQRNRHWCDGSVEQEWRNKSVHAKSGKKYAGVPVTVGEFSPGAATSQLVSFDEGLQQPRLSVSAGDHPACLWLHLRCTHEELVRACCAMARLAESVPSWVMYLGVGHRR